MHPRTAHLETHFTGSRTVRDVIIGVSDGLTVPFALAAGLSGAVSDGRVILIAGLAEIAAGAIAMGLGGYLAARSEADTYRSELARERREVRERSAEEREEVKKIFADYGLTGPALDAAVQAITSHPESWVRFMMREELGLEEPDPRRATRSGLTIGLSYIAGGAVPLGPYLFHLPVRSALLFSVLLTLLALLVFGALKARFSGMPRLRGALQTLLIGGLAAAAAFILARLVSG